MKKLESKYLLNPYLPVGQNFLLPKALKTVTYYLNGPLCRDYIYCYDNEIVLWSLRKHWNETRRIDPFWLRKVWYSCTKCITDLDKLTNFRTRITLLMIEQHTDQKTFFSWEKLRNDSKIIIFPFLPRCIWNKCKISNINLFRYLCW